MLLLILLLVSFTFYQLIIPRLKKRFEDDDEKLEDFIKIYVFILLKMDMIVVLSNFQR